MATSYIQMKFSKQKRDRKGAYITCETCSVEFYVNPGRLKRTNKVRFCSQKCYTKTGDSNPFWGKKHKPESVEKMVNHPNRVFFKGGKDNPNIRFATNDYFGSTAYWWRYHKGRKSKVCERCGFDNFNILCVHHIDRNRANNSNDNIEILCPNCHSLEHFKGKDGPFINFNENYKERKSNQP